MTKKVTLIVLAVVLVAAAFTGVYFYFDSTNSDKSPNTSTPNEIYLDEDISVEEYIVDSTDAVDETTQTYSDAFVPMDDNLSDNTLDIVTTNFTIDRIIDHTTNEEVSGRVVFGKSFNVQENYIKFDSNGNFEIFLSGYLDSIKTGTYTEYDDIVYVEFEDGTAAEYDVKYTNDGIISYIVVNYGDYDIYFS